MNLNARIGLLVPELTALWTGTANGAQSGDFVLTVTTVTGTLASTMAGMVVVREGIDLVRIKNASGTTLTLAENPAEFANGDSLAIYEIRLPFPRYQRLVGDVVYKDWNIGYPVAYQEVLPPSVAITPEALWAENGVKYLFDATQTIAVEPTGNDTTMTYDATGWATVLGYGGAVGDVIDPYCDLTPTATGFHYLKCTGTDDNAVAYNRYVPVWVDTEPIELLSISLDWSLEDGWRARCETDEQFTYLEHSPVAVVDLDTREVLMFGFIQPQDISRSFGIEKFSFEILCPLLEVEKLSAYSFIITDIDDPISDPPDDWSEVQDLSVTRAIWFLLVWHTMLPEVANVIFVETELRRIKGQEFSVGTIPNLLNEVAGAAYLIMRGARTGGMRLDYHPLYAEEGEWDGSPLALAQYDLSDSDDREENYEIQLATPNCMDVRASGVYRQYDGDYEPAICRCPAHPANWGGPTAEITNLAPIGTTELHRWAARHFAIENELPFLRLQPLVDIDPYSYPLVITDVPEADLIAIEEAHLSFDTQGLIWSLEINGHPYGADREVVDIDIPDPVEIPTPSPPPTNPPAPPLPPPVEWPTIVYVATKAKGAYVSEDFTGPDGDMPSWAKLTGGEGTLNDIRVAALSPVNATLFALKEADESVHRWTSGAGWEEILNTTEAATLVSQPYAEIKWVTCDAAGNLYAYCLTGNSTTQYWADVLKSVDDGDSWTYESNVLYYMFSLYAVGNLIVEGTSGWASIDRASGGGKAELYFGTVGVDSWTLAQVASGNWLPAIYRTPNGATWTTGANGQPLILSGTTWLTPTAAADYMCGRLTHGWPKFAAWNTDLIVTTGEPGSAFENHLHYTDDNFETAYDSGAVGREVDILHAVPNYPPNLIMARNDSATVGAPHVLFVSDDLGATTPVERAGDTPSNPATTDSIPYDCGGVCANGVLPFYG